MYIERKRTCSVGITFIFCLLWSRVTRDCQHGKAISNIRCIILPSIIKCFIVFHTNTHIIYLSRPHVAHACFIFIFYIHLIIYFSPILGVAIWDRRVISREPLCGRCRGVRYCQYLEILKVSFARWLLMNLSYMLQGSNFLPSSMEGGSFRFLPCAWKEGGLIFRSAAENCKNHTFNQLYKTCMQKSYKQCMQNFLPC